MWLFRARRSIAWYLRKKNSKAPFRLADKSLLLRYVDDTFTAVWHDVIDAFHLHLNEQNTDIQFNREFEENGKLPFLDCLVSRDDNSPRTTVYRKPSNTDRLLDGSSSNPTSHKAITIRTLTRRAQQVYNTTDSLSDENKHLDRVISKNNYNEGFIQRSTHRPTTHYVSYWLTSKTETNRGTDGEQCVRSISPTATLLTSVRLVETSQLDLLNTNDRQGKAMKTITLLNITDLRTSLLTGTLIITYSTNYF